MKEQAFDILKKFWFVILVGVIFISFAIYFAWDTNKDKIPGKSVDGKDVIFSSDDYNYTADSYYKTLFNTETDGTKAGISLLYTLLQKEVASSVDLDSATEETAKTAAENQLAAWNENGSTYLAYYGNQLKAMGYEGGIDDIEEFYLDMYKLNKLTQDYILDHKKLFDEVYEKEEPREISHILVKFDDSENPSETPTENEQKRMDAITKALKDGEKFSTVAKQSDDPGSNSVGGRLGVQKKSVNYDEKFKEAAWSLQDGEMSGWVKSSSGYHLIVVHTDKDAMFKKKSNLDSITTLMSEYYPNLSKEIIWKTANKLGLEFKDKETKKELMEYIGIEE